MREEEIKQLEIDKIHWRDLYWEECEKNKRLKAEKESEYELQCDIDGEIVLGKQASEELMQYLGDFTIDAYIAVLNSGMRLLEIKNKKKIKLLENGHYELCVRKKRKFRIFNLFN